MNLIGHAYHSHVEKLVFCNHPDGQICASFCVKGKVAENGWTVFISIAGEDLIDAD
jgi:hypothetical protein